MRLERYLDELTAKTMMKALGLADRPKTLIRPTTDPKFGDYQINGAMALAKTAGKAPRELAEPVATLIAEHEAIAKAEVAGPGFVNIWLEPKWIARTLTGSLEEPNLGIEPASMPQTIVVDYSSPNIAKQMHVGHLRSTIIGHAVVQLLKAQGHKVIGDNHLGDWGTQFGWLIVGHRKWGNEDNLRHAPIHELERLYKKARALGEEDEAFADQARSELAKLQRGNQKNTELWRRFVEATRQSLEKIYDRLGVSFDEWLGESAYHKSLSGVVDELQFTGIARPDEGAMCVFFNDLPPHFADKVPAKLKKQKQPFIIRKKDGAFLYSTTDIATVKHRRNHFEADRSVYVVGSPQQLHFEQLFAVMALLGESMKLDFVGFGQMLGSDGKVMRTSKGESVNLASLLDAAEAKALEKIEAKREEGVLRIPEDQLDDAKRIIGIGAVKFADLSKNRTTDYRFDLDAMVDFSGYAGPYLQYQYARTRSIFRTGEVDWNRFRGRVVLEEEKELALAARLAKFPDVVERAANSYQPHLICEHLYEVAKAFSAFFSACPVLKSEGEVRESRLALTKLTGEQLSRGLNMLGIGVLEQM